MKNIVGIPKFVINPISTNEKHSGYPKILWNAKLWKKEAMWLCTKLSDMIWDCFVKWTVYNTKSLRFSLKTHVIFYPTDQNTGNFVILKDISSILFPFEEQSCLLSSGKTVSAEFELVSDMSIYCSTSLNWLQSIHLLHFNGSVGQDLLSLKSGLWKQSRFFDFGFGSC